MSDRYPERHQDFGDLRRDLLALARDRRRALKLLAGASLVPWLACDSASGGDDAGASTNPDGGTASCAVIPEETGGPYPGDGSNGPNFLGLSGMVRSDIRASLAPATGTAQGVPLTVKLTLVNTRSSCAPLAGSAVYLWHCDRDGLYSMYTLASENYLRGVQVADGGGTVTFTTIFPGCYPGRWPHIHFEIYATAATASGKLKTSQLALPVDVCSAVYATTGYAQSVANLAGTSLTSDMVFSDGSSQQVPVVSGSAAAGYTAALIVGIAV